MITKFYAYTVLFRLKLEIYVSGTGIEEVSDEWKYDKFTSDRPQI